MVEPEFTIDDLRFMIRRVIYDLDNINKQMNNKINNLLLTGPAEEPSIVKPFSTIPVAIMPTVPVIAELIDDKEYNKYNKFDYMFD